MEVSGQLHAPAALPPGKNPWYPLDRRLGGPPSRSGRGGEEKNSQPADKLRAEFIRRILATIGFSDFGLIYYKYLSSV
jgi:hypothetical protein